MLHRTIEEVGFVCIKICLFGYNQAIVEVCDGETQRNSIKNHKPLASLFNCQSVLFEHRREGVFYLPCIEVECEHEEGLDLAGE